MHDNRKLGHKETEFCVTVPIVVIIIIFIFLKLKLKNLKTNFYKQSMMD